MATTPNTPDIAQADTVLSAQADMIGGIQDQAAQVVDANLAQNAKTIKTIKTGLNRKAGQGQAFQTNLVNNIVGGLGSSIGAAMSDNAGTVSTLGSAAVGMPTPTATGTTTPMIEPGVAPVTGTTVPMIEPKPTPAPTQPPAPAPAQPTDQGGYYIICQGEYANAVGPFVSPPPSSVAGPFATNIEALTYLANHPGICVQTAASPTLPAGGGTAPPQQYDSSQWAVMVNTAMTCEPAIENGGQINLLLSQGWVILKLFSDQFSAQNYVAALPKDANGYPTVCNQTAAPPAGGNGTTSPVTIPPPPPQCPAPPPCPVAPPPPPPPAALGCASANIPDILTIGSASFCLAKDDLRKSFVTLGQWAIDLINTLGLDTIVTKPTDISSTDILTSPVSTTIQALWDVFLGWFSDKTKDALNQITGMIKCWYGALKSAKTCNISEVMSLCIARGIIDLLQRARLGWDVAIWGTVDITIHIDPLIKVLDYLIADACPDEIPSIGEAIEAFVHGRVGEDQFTCWLSLRGADKSVWEPIIRTRMELIPDREFIQWGRRTGMADADIEKHLIRYGYLAPDERARRMLVYDELPTIAEHLHWLQRNVFDDNYVKTYDLLNGFKERFWAKFGDQLRAQGYTQDRASLEYAAHWIIPPTGQLAEMMQRLRPGRVDPSIQFAPADFNALLAEQDIAPYYRERLAYVSYRTLPLRQLNQAVQQGRYDRTELVERFKDIGYRQTDAETLSDTYLASAARQVASAGKGYTASLIAELAQYGLISKADANKYLNPQGFDADKVDLLYSAASDKKLADAARKHDQGTINEYATLAIKAYEDGTISSTDATATLQAAGYSANAATLALATADLRVKKATIDLAVTATHKAYRYGAVDAASAANALILAGVQPPMASIYVARWRLEMSIPRIAASTAAILRWTKKGIMSVPNAAIRLANLGWAQGDIDLSLLEVEQEAAAAKQAAAARTAKALVAAQKQAANAVKQSQKNLCRIYTPAKMIRWYALRIIDDATFAERLTQCGYAEIDIAGLIREASVARAAKDAKAAKSGASGVEYTGPGAVPGGPTP